jgi:hypothetical protein
VQNVSSILKALKKLEQETAENAGAPLASGVRGRPERQPKKRSGALVVPGLAAFTVCLFAGVGILIYTQNASVSESPAVHDKDEKPVSAEKIPAEKISAPKKAAAIDNRKQARTDAAAPEFEFATAGTSIAEKQLLDVKKDIQKLPAAQPSRISPETLPEMETEAEKERLTAQPEFEYATASIKTADPFSSIVPDSDVVNKNRMLTDENPEPAAAFQPDVVVDGASVPDLPDMRKRVFFDKPVVKKTEPPVVVIEDPSFELQAISWSADPDKRLAIINGKICREKDHVGGYMIQAIKSDEVILTKGSVKGKLVFEIR